MYVYVSVCILDKSFIYIKMVSEELINSIFFKILNIYKLIKNHREKIKKNNKEK